MPSPWHSQATVPNYWRLDRYKVYWFDYSSWSSQQDSHDQYARICQQSHATLQCYTFCNTDWLWYYWHPMYQAIVATATPNPWYDHASRCQWHQVYTTGLWRFLILLSCCIYQSRKLVQLRPILQLKRLLLLTNSYSMLPRVQMLLSPIEHPTWLLRIHSDASYLSETHARSRAGGFIYFASTLLYRCNTNQRFYRLPESHYPYYWLLSPLRQLLSMLHSSSTANAAMDIDRHVPLWVTRRNLC